jgi:CelD/BcsL family acetyltransferase involved in cellulose biosynthesis
MVINQIVVLRDEFGCTASFVGRPDLKQAMAPTSDSALGALIRTNQAKLGFEIHDRCKGDLYHFACRMADGSTLYVDAENEAEATSLAEQETKTLGKSQRCIDVKQVAQIPQEVPPQAA